MCDPVSISAVISVGVGVYSSVKTQEAQNEANRYQEDIANRNASIAEMQAQDAEARGSQEVKDYRRKVAAAIGSQKSALASGGVLVSEGSAGDILANTQAQGDIDALQIKKNAANEALGYRMQSANMLEEARLNRSRIRDPSQLGALSLLSQGSSLAFSYYGANRKTTGVSSSPSSLLPSKTA